MRFYSPIQQTDAEAESCLYCDAISSEGEQEKAKMCYARSNSAHQRQDPRQASPENEIVQDVGSGLNWKCPGFKTLLEHVFGDHIAEIVVAHRDRLCRLAFKLLEEIFRFHKVRLVVLDVCTSPGSGLSNDLLTIFVATTGTLYGKPPENPVLKWPKSS